LKFVIERKPLDESPAAFLIWELEFRILDLRDFGFLIFNFGFQF